MLVMALYSYIVEHDYGLAPNPFGQYCTLAVCKPQIRKSGLLKLNDWIIGTGSKSLEELTDKKFINHLIYAMKVEEIISMQEYWDDLRFEYKKPIVNGPLNTMYGDNFYHKDESGNWVQENSAHSNPDGSSNKKHLEIDIGGKNVLIGKTFYYFGRNAPLIPEKFIGICHSGIGMKKVTDESSEEFIKWLKIKYEFGIHGDPVNWVEHNKQLNKLTF